MADRFIALAAEVETNDDGDSYVVTVDVYDLQPSEQTLIAASHYAAIVPDRLAAHVATGTATVRYNASVAGWEPAEHELVCDLWLSDSLAHWMFKLYGDHYAQVRAAVKQCAESAADLYDSARPYDDRLVTRAAEEAAHAESDRREAARERAADNAHASSRALVERLAGHAGIGDSSRTARLTVVSAKGE